ncbi:DNA methyltransferase [Halorussus salinus]|uniref:DNA methyltransferase n=1 Tax=Halorussus salinus TaxID=1364935 RepID=UPI00192F19F2|nr:DNA methyltransferase [Halorussus salinus]
MVNEATATTDTDHFADSTPMKSGPASRQPPQVEFPLLHCIDWSFNDADTDEHVHGPHNYPAQMPPQIPRTLFQYFQLTGDLTRGDWVYDPFSGSGTTAVEARLAGLNSLSHDVNPFACELTQANAIPLDPSLLTVFRDRLLTGLQTELQNVRERHHADAEIAVQKPAVREGWFPYPQLYELCKIRDRITVLKAETPDAPVCDGIIRLFRVALAYTTRRVSYQRNGEFKRHRIADADRDDHDPDVFDIFTDQLSETIDALRTYTAIAPHTCTTTVLQTDSRKAEHLDPNSIDIVLTSPPYGDHATTVAYGQYSQDPAIVAWGRDYEEMRQVDKDGLGGKNEILEPLPTLEQWSPTLAETLDSLRKKDGRADDALDFFTDFYAVLEDVARVVKPGQPVVWVVGNRTMSRVPIPTHLITLELCNHLGFTHETTLARDIPDKTLPWENAPENLPGVTNELMASEYILLMRAPEATA